MRKLSTKEFIIKARNIHGSKYDYSLSKYTKSSEEISIICPKHGVFKQTPCNHLQGRGCKYCAGNIKNTKEEFIKKANEMHSNKFSYENSKYTNGSTKIEIKCNACGCVFTQKPKAHLSGSGCPSCAGKRKTNEIWIHEFNKMHSYFYDYSNITEKIISSLKISIICPIHGEFIQNAQKHKCGNGCPKCKFAKLKLIDRIRKYKNKLTYLYYIRINNFYKVGLTQTNLKERYKNENIEYEIINVWEFENGLEAFDIEQAILRETCDLMIQKEESPILGGWTEIRSKDIYKQLLYKVNNFY